MKLRPVRGAVLRHYIEDFQLPTAIAGTVLFVAATTTIGFAPYLRGRSGSSTAADRLPDGVAAVLGIEPGLSLNTAAGHLDAWMVSLAAPLILCALALPLAVRAVAGCEARGEMEWLATQPIRRTQIVIERFVAITVLTVEATIPATIVLAFGGSIGELELGVGVIVWSMMRVVVLVSTLTGITLIASAVGAGVRLAGGIALLVPVVAFTMLLTDIATPLSPVRWTLGATPAADSGTLTGVAFALIVTVGCVAIAAEGFQRRDLLL